MRRIRSGLPLGVVGTRIFMWSPCQNQLGLLISALLDQPPLDFHHKPLLASPVSLERLHQLDLKRRPGQDRWGSLEN